MKNCQICQKGTINSVKHIKLRGKFNPTSKNKKYPNLQWLRVPENIQNKKFSRYASQRVKACAKCIKAVGKEK